MSNINGLRRLYFCMYIWIYLGNNNKELRGCGGREGIGEGEDGTEMMWLEYHVEN